MQMNLAEQKHMHLWEQYLETPTVQIRNEIAMAYSYLVKCIALQLRGIYETYAEVDDMVNQGLLVLLDSIERFDLTKNVKFETYASLRVRGAIIDYVRKQDWVPRKIKKDVRLVEETYQLLSNELGRHPSVDEVSAKLNISTQQVEKALSQGVSFHMLSFEELMVDGIFGTKGYKSPAEGIDENPEGYLQQQEFKEILAQSIDRLTEKEKTVVSLYYYEELKLKEIAYVLEVSESRVCQIHANALKKMKKYILEYSD